MKNLTLIQKISLLQLEQYEYVRYLNVVKQGMNATFESTRLRWTTRAKLTYLLSRFIGLKLTNQLIQIGVNIYENWIYQQTKNSILALKRRGMKVVAIAGSYGKTSVKNNLYDILRSKYKVVATPESFNTVMGIAKCLRYEVGYDTQVFVVEVGAYHIGDITRLLEMVCPDMGILTGIAKQHLERFGSFENIMKAKGEIVEYMMQKNLPIAANMSDQVVLQVVDKLGAKVEAYGDEKSRHLCNLSGAKIVAKLLGMNDKEISKARIRVVINRFEMTNTRYGMQVIDDSFSSNDVGFRDALSYLGKQKKFTRILVTPGIVELGRETALIHQELGKLIIGNVDIAILVGRNVRTANLEIGINHKVKVMYINSTLEFVKLVKDLKLKKEPLVLIENDVTENYL